MKTVPSVLCVWGREHYKLHELVEEAEQWGISKRIPITGVIEGLIPFSSKIFAAHPDAIVEVTRQGVSLAELAAELQCEPDSMMLDLAIALSKSPERSMLIKEYLIEFTMGIVGYSPYTGTQVVVPHGTEEVPEEVKDYVDRGVVEPVHIEYITEETEDAGNL